MDLSDKEMRFLKLLAKQYPTIPAASTEIINLSAIMELPKGTEHFISDIHGEYESFLHVLRNGSGSIKRRIEEIFQDTLLKQEKQNLATLIYYPQKKLPLILKDVEHKDEWYRITLFRLIKICLISSSKYTRSKVRKALPKDLPTSSKSFCMNRKVPLTVRSTTTALLNPLSIPVERKHLLLPCLSWFSDWPLPACM